MDATKTVQLDHGAVRTLEELAAWASGAFDLAGHVPIAPADLMLAIWNQVGARAQSYLVVELHPERASHLVSVAIEPWRSRFAWPMFHDWGCTIEFAA